MSWEEAKCPRCGAMVLRKPNGKLSPHTKMVADEKSHTAVVRGFLTDRMVAIPRLGQKAVLCE